MTERLPRLPTLVLGILSITAFGSWFYGYGVLVEPIARETGWSATSLGGAYGASLLATGILGALVGRALDHVGSRRTFLVLAAGTVVFLWLTSLAASAALFVVLATLGGGFVGAGGYYAATSAVMARLVPAQRAKGITALTLFGAFASPIALPAIAWLVTALDWRPTMRILAVVVGLSYLLAAFGVPNVRPEAAEPLHLRAAARTAFDSIVKRRVIASVSIMAGATAVLLVQQVPVMVEAGMALSAASAYAGARGFLQLGGRLPLPAVVRRFGSRPTLQGSYALTAIAVVLLVGAGTPLRAGAYAVVAGLSIGALAAIESIYAAEVFDGPTLGTSLGIMSLLRGIGAALGPTVGGMLIDAFGRQAAALTLAFTAAVVATVLVPRRH